MKKIFLYLLPLTFFIACNVTHEDRVESPEKVTEVTSNTFEIDLSENDELTHENLRIYPVIATESFINENVAPSKMKSLSEGIKTKGFYVTEKKPYGRFEDSGAVNSLTIQNKSDETIYIMQGDVVSGGNQDRVIAQNVVVPPRTITDIEVYCVEKGRWQYRNENIEGDDAESKKKRKIFAFSGYYNVASNGLRKTVRETKNQQSVWTKVGELTSKNNAKTSTGTYTGLEGSNEFTNKRDAYVKFFDGKLMDSKNVVGFIAVSGNDIIGADIFGHPQLFKNKFNSLLHGYVTDAITDGSKVNITEKRLNYYMKQLNKKFEAAKKDATSSDELFKYEGQIVHFSKL